MGWASGSHLAEDVWKIIKKFIPEDQKQTIAKKIYDKFCEGDADDWDFQKDNLYFNALQLEDPELFKECLEEME